MIIHDQLTLILQIRDPGDRALGWNQLEEVLREKDEKKPERMGRLQYTLEWVQYIFHRTYGIAAHIVLGKEDKLVYPYYAIFLMGSVFFVYNLKNNLDHLFQTIQGM